jgi:hypothetical protein
VNLPQESEAWTIHLIERKRYWVAAQAGQNRTDYLSQGQQVLGRGQSQLNLFGGEAMENAVTGPRARNLPV